MNTFRKIFHKFGPNGTVNPVISGAVCGVIILFLIELVRLIFS